MYSVTLPWPPSVNHYWRKWQNRMVISREGRDYRRRVERLCAAPAGKFGGGSGNKKPPRLALCMDAFPPDRRRRDLDNLQKASLDSLAHAGVYQDDQQIDMLLVQRREPNTPGMIALKLFELPLRKCPLCGSPIPQKESKSKNVRNN